MNDETTTGRPLRLLLFLTLFLLAVLTSLFLFGRQTEAAPLAASGPANVEGSGPNCRYGAAVGPESHNPFLTELGVGWIINFGVAPGRPTPTGIEYVSMIRMKQDLDSQGHRLPTYTITTQPLNDNPGGLGPLVTAYPGKLWIVGNEVDREYWQDDMEPAVYALAYYDVYHFIKQRDPSAQVAISGLVEVTPNRLEYLDLVWQSYLDQFGTPMPVDVWTFHIYILPEARLNGQGEILGSNASIAIGTACYENRDAPSCAEIKWESNLTPVLCPQDSVYCYAEHDDANIFIGQLQAMRQWMKAHGQQQKPLLLTEFSLLYPFMDYDDPVNPTVCYLQDEYAGCFTAARVSQFMQETVQYMETAVDPNLGYALDNHRLVQQWLWYAMNDGVEGTPNALINDPETPTALTAVGQAYQQTIASHPLQVNMVAASASHTAVFSTTSSLISATLRNNGNTPTSTGATVTFYADAALTVEIGSVVIPAGLGGCASDTATVSVTWNGLTPGLNRFWAAVSYAEDSNPADNIVTGTVLVDPEQLFLPAISR
jgi:hypothetical protein